LYTACQHHLPLLNQFLSLFTINYHYPHFISKLDHYQLVDISGQFVYNISAEGRMSIYPFLAIPIGWIFGFIISAYVVGRLLGKGALFIFIATCSLIP